MKIFVKTLTGETSSVNVEGTDSVQQAKQKILCTLYKDNPPVKPRLIFAGRQLEDSCSLDSCKIQEGTIILLLQQKTPRTTNPKTENLLKQKIKKKLYRGPNEPSC